MGAVIFGYKQIILQIAINTCSVRIISDMPNVSSNFLSKFSHVKNGLAKRNKKPSVQNVLNSSSIEEPLHGNFKRYFLSAVRLFAFVVLYFEREFSQLFSR